MIVAGIPGNRSCAKCPESSETCVMQMLCNLSGVCVVCTVNHQVPSWLAIILTCLLQSCSKVEIHVTRLSSIHMADMYFVSR
jgi:hypothetical protein